MPPQDPRSILFITLDSCRHDTFAAANVPNLKSIGPLHRAMAPATFTYASHMAMFMGFTPGVYDRPESYVNPKFGKVFKMIGTGAPSRGRDYFRLQGRNIIDGFKRRGHRAIGTAAVAWFDPKAESGRELHQHFDDYFYAGDTWSLQRQMDWLSDRLKPGAGPVFVFVNVGETHVPYYHAGAAWDRTHVPCVPFGEKNDAAECRRRQTACVEFADRLLGPLIESFARGTIFACGDHGDAWGEDGLWEHGIHHPKVFEVPLLFRLGAKE
jgi:hypothetical protein